MVNLEGPPPPSAAVSHHMVSCNHCSQFGCRFCSRLWFVCFCLLCFASPSSLLASNPFFLSFFLSSLSFLLLVGWLSLAPRLQTSGGSSPWVPRPPPVTPPWLLASPLASVASPRCSSAVWFLGLGAALLLGLVPRPRFGAPPPQFPGLASVRCSA